MQNIVVIYIHFSSMWSLRNFKLRNPRTMKHYKRNFGCGQRAMLWKNKKMLKSKLQSLPIPPLPIPPLPLYICLTRQRYCQLTNEYTHFHRAMQFVNDFQLLKIEDILPFFPDFVTIDHFKVGFISTFIATLLGSLYVCFTIFSHQSMKFLTRASYFLSVGSHLFFP